MLVERTLPNGLELVIRPTNAPVAAIQAWVDVGSLDERTLEAGYCHFLEHMLFKGTEHRTTAEIAGTVEGSGGEMNAFTSFEYTVYHITLSNQRWELANEILADMVLGSVFEPGEFNPEKEVILEEIRRGEDSPERQLYRGAYKQLYGTSGYGRPVIGFPATVQRCTAGTLKRFWRRWYAPRLMTVVICGDVDPGAVENQVRKTWGRAKGKAPRERRRDLGYDQRIPPPRARAAARPFPVNSVRWVGALPGCTLRDQVLPALDVSGMILGQGESSRLYKRLFRDEQSVTSISAGVWAPAGVGMYTFDAEAPLEKAGLFRKSLHEEVARFCDEGPSAEELERAKVAIETDRVYSMQSMDGLANRMGFLKTTLGNTSFDLEYMAQARELTAEDVRAAARRYVHLDLLREFALVPKAFDSADLWRHAPAGPVRPRKAVRLAVPGRERISLPNGIELVLFPREDVPVVTLQACVMGGLRAETRETAGIGSMLSEVWEKGPAGWTAERFAAFLEARGARMESFSGRNSLGLGCTTLTRYLEEIAPLFAETLFKPALAADECERARTVALEDIRTSEDDLARFAGTLFCETLFESHPYRFPVSGYADSVSRISREMLDAHFRKCVDSRPVVVAASGKFNPAYLVPIFEKLARSGPADDSQAFLANSPPSAPRDAEARKNREQSHIIVGYSGTRVTDSERFDLKVLLTALGGQSGRLFTELRDKKGLCYSVAPICMEGVEPGYVGVYMGCDPMKRLKALAGIRAELDRVAAKPLGAAELARAKEFVLGRHHMDMQLNSAIASAMGFATLYGLAFDEHLRLAENLRDVTAQSVHRLAERLFTAPAVTAQII